MKTIILVLALSVFPAGATPSDCEKQSVQQALHWADTIFEGTVTAASKRSAIFEVSEYWKGDLGPRKVLSALPGGYPFKVGQKYLVYAKKVKMLGRVWYTTSVCTRTSLVKAADKDLKQLGPPKVIVK